MLKPGDIAIVSGARTPFGRYCGKLKDFTAQELGAIAGKCAIERAGLEPNDFDHVVFGNAQQTSGDALYGARHVGLRAGLPIETPALTVNRLCGSGMQSIVNAAQMVQLGEANDFAGVRGNIRKVAAAIDRRAAGEALVARMDAELAASRGAWGGARALYLTPGGFTAGHGTLAGAMMEAAGLISASDRPGYQPAPLEQLVLQPPAALVLAFFSDLAGGRQRWTIAGNGYLRRLAAERTIASLPGSMLGCPAWTSADGALALAKSRARRHS